MIYIKLRECGTRIDIKYDSYDFNFKSLPGAVDMKEGISVPATEFMARRILRMVRFSERQAGVWVDPAVGVLRASADQLKKRIQRHSKPGHYPQDWREHYVFKTTPRDHQIRARMVIAGSRAVYLNMWMGAGKTKIAIDSIANYRPRAKAVLLVGPKSALEDVWPDELDKHWPHQVGEYRYCLSEKAISLVRRVEDFVSDFNADRVNIFPITYEGMIRAEVRSWIAKFPWDMTIWDEAHRLRSPSGKMAQAAMQFNSGTRGQRIMMSGTMVADSPRDTYSQMRALDCALLGTNVEKFDSKYVKYGGFNNYQILGYKNLDHLAKKIAPIVFEVGQDSIDVPSQNDVFRWTAFSPEAKKQYRTLEKEMVLALAEDEFVINENTLHKITRSIQLTSGFLKLESGEERRVNRAKLDLLVEVEEDLPKSEPLVVVCRFKEDLRAVAEVLQNRGRQTFEYSGARRELREWRRSSNGVIVAQVQAAKEAIDLTKSCYMLLYSTGHSLEWYEQIRARISRPGQSRVTHFIHLGVRDTVDVVINRALRDKKQVKAALLNYYRRLVRK